MKRTLVLVGGGHAHVEVLRQLALNPPADVDVALFDPSPSVWFPSMLPGVIAGHYDSNDAVSYTHLDVYKRQARNNAARANIYR